MCQNKNLFKPINQTWNMKYQKCYLLNKTRTIGSIFELNFNGKKVRLTEIKWMNHVNLYDY